MAAKKSAAKSTRTEAFKVRGGEHAKLVDITKPRIYQWSRTLLGPSAMCRCIPKWSPTPITVGQDCGPDESELMTMQLAERADREVFRAPIKISRNKWEVAS